jgi:hypothetical protein
VDPILAVLISVAPISPRLLHPPQDAPLRAGVTFRERISSEDLEAIRRAGARPVELEVGGLAVVGRVVSVDVLQADLQKISRVRGVVRIDPVIPPVRVAPLDVTAPKVGAPLAWSAPESDDRWAGDGIVIADHEGGWNIFHPDFFFLDGGRYGFEDRDSDGRAGSGDGIDLDGDGAFEATLSLLEGVTEDFYTGERVEEPGYQPDVDWLYIDLDGNGGRDAGRPFAEDTPGLGEPTFVGDDIDRNGELDLHEQLLRLGTSKVRSVVIDGAEFHRGENLTAYPLELFDLFHGTGAIGIAAGGAIGVRRYTGIAPEAELVLITSSDPVASIATARTLGANVSFYEWNSPADLQDGSGPVETAISDAAASGVVQLAAAGNLANADHVMELRDFSSSATVAFTTDDLGTYAYRTFWLNLHWNAPRSRLDVKVVGPSGEALEVPSAGISQALVGGILLTAYPDQTQRGNGSVLIVGTSSAGAPLPNRVLSLQLTNSSTTSIERVRGVLFDDQSGWAKGVSWTSDRSDSGSALMPSTSDAVIAVGAYGGRHDLAQFGWGGIDEHRTYSGMGPRIDGARIVDIAAPDDPFTPAILGDASVLYSAFGGTSGALPHVAGAAAALLSSGVPFSHAAIETLIEENARTDAMTGEVPNEAFGFGRIDLGLSLFGRSLANGSPPGIELLGPETAVVGTPVAISAEISQPGGDINDVLIAWDLGYDGVDDEPISAALRFTTTPESTGLLRVVARAKNLVTGRTSRALYVVTVGEDCATTGTCPPADAGADAGSVDSDFVITPRKRDEGCDCSSARSADGSWFLLLSAALLLRRSRARNPRS